jgi:TonB family protein
MKKKDINSSKLRAVETREPRDTPASEPLTEATDLQALLAAIVGPSRVEGPLVEAPRAPEPDAPAHTEPPAAAPPASAEAEATQARRHVRAEARTVIQHPSSIAAPRAAEPTTGPSGAREAPEGDSRHSIERRLDQLIEQLERETGIEPSTKTAALPAPRLGLLDGASASSSMRLRGIIVAVVLIGGIAFALAVLRGNAPGTPGRVEGAPPAAALDTTAREATTTAALTRPAAAPAPAPPIPLPAVAMPAIVPSVLQIPAPPSEVVDETTAPAAAASAPSSAPAARSDAAAPASVPATPRAEASPAPAPAATPPAATPSAAAVAPRAETAPAEPPARASQPTLAGDAVAVGASASGGALGSSGTSLPGLPAPRTPPAAAPASSGTSATPASSTPAPAATPPGPTRPARVVTRVPPEYPQAARRMSLTGSVEVQYTVDAEGRVLAAKAVSGHSVLRVAAEVAVRQWRFEPALVEGRPVTSGGRVIIEFQP